MRARLVLTLAAAVLALAACEDVPQPLPPPQPPPEPPPAAAAAPVVADPAPVTDGDVTIAYANGIKILVKRIPGADFAALQLYVRGGARDWTAADAGIERLALSAATSGGTVALDKDAFARRLAALGSELGSESRADFSAIKAKSLGTKWDETFALLADTFLHPALPEAEVALARQRQLSALRHEQESPDALLGLRVHEVFFKGHPFANRSIGTVESVEKIDLDAVKAHLARLREASRLLFVTAGDVDPAHVVEKVRAAFGALPRGGYTETPFPAVSFDKPALTLTEKKLATNYIEGTFPAPRVNDPELPAALVTMSLLRFRLFEEVRTKRNLSYAPGAGLGTSTSVPMGYLYVTAVDPNTTLKVMLDEARRLQNEPISAKDLAGTKATFLTSYLMGNESCDGQAAMLAEAELLGGSFQLARTLPERIRAVTPAAVQAYAKKYLGRLQTVVIGDPSKIDRGLFESLLSPGVAVLYTPLTNRGGGSPRLRRGESRGDPLPLRGGSASWREQLRWRGSPPRGAGAGASACDPERHAGAVRRERPVPGWRSTSAPSTRVASSCSIRGWRCPPGTSTIGRRRSASTRPCAGAPRRLCRRSKTPRWPRPTRGTRRPATGARRAGRRGREAAVHAPVGQVVRGARARSWCRACRVGSPARPRLSRPRAGRARPRGPHRRGAGARSPPGVGLGGAGARRWAAPHGAVARRRRGRPARALRDPRLPARRVGGLLAARGAGAGAPERLGAVRAAGVPGAVLGAALGRAARPRADGRPLRPRRRRSPCSPRWRSASPTSASGGAPARTGSMYSAR